MRFILAIVFSLMPWYSVVLRCFALVLRPARPQKAIALAVDQAQERYTLLAHRLSNAIERA